MAIIELPPTLDDIMSDRSLKSVARLSRNPEIREIARQANDRYKYWQKFKYIPIPDGFKHEEIWHYIKLLRLGNLKDAPFKDKNNVSFKYWVPDGMHKELNRIDRLSGQAIISNEPHLPSSEQYIIKSLMAEAIASSQLEGASTTTEAAKEMLTSNRKPKNKHEKMIFNNWRIMQFVRENHTQKLTSHLLKGIHKIITEDTLENPSEAGEFRVRDDIVVGYNNQVAHIPPAYKTLKERTENFIRFANSDEDTGWIHPVIKGAMLHFWLAYDHPFTDGNGRTARALFYWYLMSRGYSLFEYVAISKYIVKAPGKYVRAYLYTETDGNDLTYFLNYNLRAIRQALDDLHKYINAKQKEVKLSTVLLKKYRGLNFRQKSLLHHAIRHPKTMYTIQRHKSNHGIAYDTARHDLLDLAKRNLLEKEKQGKEFVFYPSKKTLTNLNKK